MRDLRELIAGYLEGDLAEEEVRELERLLRTDAGARGAFARALRQEVLLPEVLQEDVAPALPATARRRMRSRRLLAVRPSRSPLVPILAAAGLLAALAGAAVIASRPRSAAPPVPTVRAPEPVPPEERVEPPRETPLPAPPRPAELPVRPEPRRESEPAPKPPPRPLEPVPSPAPTPTPPAPPVRPVTVPAAALLAAAEGGVLLDGAPSAGGRPIPPGAALEVAPGGRAVAVYPDGTRLELAGGTRLREIFDVGPERGKRAILERGTITVEAARQPEGRPLVVASPHAEARVVGTTFRLLVEEGTTRLEVRRGRVRLARLSDGQAVDVPAGFFAVAAPGADVTLGSERAVTTAFQDGVAPTPRYEGTRDAQIWERAALREKNGGRAEALYADGDTQGTGDDRAILLRWDLAALPRGSRVLSVALELTVLDASAGRSFDLFEVRRDWSETQVTWNRATSATPWQAPGLAGSADRGRVVLGRVAPAAPGRYSLKLNPEGVAVVQAWVDDPSRNHGFLIAHPTHDDAILVASREAAAPPDRPRLVVTSVPPGR